MPRAREINLIPYDVILKTRMQGRILIWACVALFVVAALVGGHRVENRRMTEAKRDVASLSMKKDEMEEKISQLHTLQEKRNRLARKERVVNTLAHKRSLSLVFSELEKAINDRVRLTEFSFKDGMAFPDSDGSGKGLDQWVETGYFIVKKGAGEKKEHSERIPGLRTSLKGVAKTNTDLAGFLQNLTGSTIFREVNLRYSKTGRQESQSMVEFEIEALLSRTM